jgi:DNA polymerase
MSKKTNIKQINQLIEKCQFCNLYKSKKNYVRGRGSLNSQLFLIGEAPGYYEDIKGIPFVGKAGKILDQLLFSISLNRNNIYITNILKCRPPNNRNPTKKEIEICTNYLNKEIKIIKPSIISPLGNYASKFIFKKYDLIFEKISIIHGKIFQVKNNNEKLYIIPQYHPAVSVYNSNMIKTLINDFKIIQKILNKI